MSDPPQQPSNPALSAFTFIRRTLWVALFVTVILVTLTAYFIEIREQVLNNLSGELPKQLGPSVIVTVSANDQLQVATAAHGIVVQDRETEEDRFGVALSLHPIHGQLCRSNYLAPGDDPTSFQQWDPVASRWQSAGEGLLLKTILATKQVLLLVFVCFLVAYVMWDFGLVPGWMPSVLTVLGVALFILGALRLAPISWRTHSIVVATFNSDASRLATCSQHGSDLAVCIWNASTGYGLARHDLHDLPPDALEFSPDDRVIIAFKDGVQLASWEVDEY